MRNGRNTDIQDQIVEAVREMDPVGHDPNFCLNEEYQAQCLIRRSKIVKSNNLFLK